MFICHKSTSTSYLSLCLQISMCIFIWYTYVYTLFLNGRHTCLPCYCIHTFACQAPSYAANRNKSYLAAKFVPRLPPPCRQERKCCLCGNPKGSAIMCSIAIRSWKETILFVWKSKMNAIMCSFAICYF